MSKEWKIASRPENLKPAKVKPGTKPPVDLPKDESDDAVNNWCEELRDHHEGEGELLTVNGMFAYAEGSGLSSEEDTRFLKKQITKIYGKPEKKEKKEMTTTTKSATEKKTNKSDKKEKKNSSKPEKKTAPKKTAKAEVKTKPDKKTVTKTEKPESKVIYSKTVRGIPVRITETSPGKYRGTLFSNEDSSGYPLRGVLRWMGFQGWTPSEGRTVLSSILKGWDKGEEYAAALVEEGHVSSGKNGHDGVFGKYSELSKNEAKLVKSVKQG